jgi:hypothetical protein
MVQRVLELQRVALVVFIGGAGLVDFDTESARRVMHTNYIGTLAVASGLVRSACCSSSSLHSKLILFRLRRVTVCTVCSFFRSRSVHVCLGLA